MFNNYQAHGNYQDAAKHDEEVMLKQMAERESKELNNIERKKKAELRNKDDAANALRQQILEKQAQKEMTRQNDAIYARQVNR